MVIVIDFIFEINIEFFCFVFLVLVICKYYRSGNFILLKKKSKMYNFKFFVKYKYSK